MRGDKSFAYDLIVPHRRVSSRVVLLLRSTERKRSWPRFVDFYNLPLIYGLVPGVEGGSEEGAAAEGCRRSVSWAEPGGRAGKGVLLSVSGRGRDLGGYRQRSGKASGTTAPDVKPSAEQRVPRIRAGLCF